MLASARELAEPLPPRCPGARPTARDPRMQPHAHARGRRPPTRTLRPDTASAGAARSATRRPRRTGRRLPPSSRPAAARRPSRRAPRSGSSVRSGRPSRSASPPPRRTSDTSPAESPACRCRSSYRPSSGRTWSGRAPRAGETRPSSPSAERAANLRSAPAARPDASAARPRAFRSGRAWSRPRPARAASAPARAARRGSAPLYPSRRRRSAPRGVPRPPDRGC